MHAFFVPPSQVAVYVSDVSAQEQARVEQELAASVYRYSSEAMMITDASNCIVAINPAFTRLTGYVASDVLGHKPSVLSSGRHDGAFYRDMWASVLEHGYWEGELWNRRKNGELYPQWLTIHRLNNMQGEATHYVGVSTDLSRLRRTEAELAHLTHHDLLTGLPNRLLALSRLDELVERCAKHGQRAAVLHLDVDRFKLVNDSLGHPAGDELLQQVAERLLRVIGPDHVLARLGGDEFVVLLTRLHTRDDAAVVAGKMVEVLKQPFQLQGHEVRVSASVGLDWYEGGDDDVETLLRHADMAMYQAKSAGRNGWCFFSPEMDHSMTQRLMVEAGLRRAMLGNELLLHYQPQVSCRTGVVLGVEALVRWQHPTLGLLSPDRFIPQAENSGQIDELGAWVMRRACQQLHDWHAAGLTGLSMAVNVSAVEFARPGFVPRLRQVLADTGIQPSQLELEITETALMQALPELVVQMGEITRMGVSLSLDDFGTGYSSLGYLKRLPLHRLKIDKSFIRDLPGDAEDEAIVLATLSMAHALGLEVVAEGVELTAQRDFLAHQGCDQIQGWLVARAMPAPAFEDWLRSHGGKAF